MTSALYTLNNNYRSSSAICAAAQHLIEHNKNRVPKTLHAANQIAGEILVQACDDFYAEMLFIANTIRRLKCESNAAVLVRTNAACESYRNGLAGFGIPIAKKEVSDMPQDWRVVTAFLACLIDVSNDLLCERFISELRGAEEAERSRRQAISKQIGLNDHCLHFKQLVTAREAVGYIAATRPSAQSLSVLTSALDAIDDCAPIADLVIALAQHNKQVRTSSCGLEVCTFHGSKGQEWNTVFLPMFEDGCFPSNRDTATPEALQEARRLAYVAVTRAEQNLFISWGRTRQENFGRHETLDRQPSRFLAEMQLA